MELNRSVQEGVVICEHASRWFIRTIQLTNGGVIYVHLLPFVLLESIKVRVHLGNAAPVSVVHVLPDESDGRLCIVRVEGGQVQIVDKEDHLGRPWRPVRTARLFLQAGCHA